MSSGAMKNQKPNPRRPLTGSLAYLSATPEYDRMARIWRDKSFGRFRYIDWNKMEALGFKQRLEELICYQVEGQRFKPFKKLFSIDEPVYMEMITEFMTTYTYEQDGRDGDGLITFRYMGSLSSLTLAQFAQHLDLYTPEEIRSPLFTEGATTLAISTTPAETWSQWSPRSYFSGIKATQLRDPVLQILHKLIACSLDGKHTTNGRVAEFDVTLMQCILEKKNIQVAHLVADRILKEKSFDSKRSFMGPVVTRLLRRMGLVRNAEIEKFKSWSDWSAQPLDYEFLRNIEILKITRNGEVYIKARATDPDSVDTLVPGLIASKEGKKRKRTGEMSDHESDEDEDNIADESTPPRAVPPPTRVEPSTPAPRIQVPGYAYHYGTPPGPEYWFWLMQMQVRCYSAIRQQQAGLPVDPLPDLPVGLGRTPPPRPHVFRPTAPVQPLRPHPNHGHGPPPRTIPRPTPQTAQIPVMRQTAPSVVGSARGQVSRDSGRTRISRRVSTAQSRRSFRQPDPTDVLQVPVSSHRQTDLFAGHTQQASPVLPLDSSEMPTGPFMEMLNGVFTDTWVDQEVSHEGAQFQNNMEDDSSSDGTSCEPIRSSVSRTPPARK